MVVVVWRKLESTKRAGKPGEAKSKRAIRPGGKKETGGRGQDRGKQRKEGKEKNEWKGMKAKDRYGSKKDIIETLSSKQRN